MSQIPSRWGYRVLALGLATGTPLAARACATCGCTLSADGAMGYSVNPGWRINFEYDYINQDELRHGMHPATPQHIVDHMAVHVDMKRNGGEALAHSLRSDPDRYRLRRKQDYE